MRFRDCISLNLCPLLVRFTLAAIFIWFGIGKFQTTTFRGEDVIALQKLGVVSATIQATTPPPDPTGAAAAGGVAEEQPGDEAAGPPSDGEEVEQPPGDAGGGDGEGDGGAGGDDNAGTDEGATDNGSGDQVGQPVADAGGEVGVDDNGPVSEDPVEVSDADAGNQGEATTALTSSDELTAEAVGLYHIAIWLERDWPGHPYPLAMAWAAALTEVIGGALLVVGLLSRVWGAGLSISMVYALYLKTILPLMGMAGAGGGLWIMQFGNLGFGDQIGTMFRLACLALALVVFLGGPGSMSLDRMIFRKRGVVTGNADG